MQRSLPLILAVLAAGPGPARAGGGAVSDDYAKALAQARARGVPVFVDAWAPW